MVIQKVHSPIIFWRQNNQLVSKSWLSSRQHKNQPSTIGYFYTLTFWSHSLVKTQSMHKSNCYSFWRLQSKDLSFWVVYFYQLLKNKWQKPHTQLYLGYTKPIWDNVKYWHGSKIRVLCFKTSHILVVFLKESRERCSITSRTPYSGFRLLFFIFITRKIVMIGFITKLMSLTQQTDGKCNEENCQQNLCLHKEVMILFYTLLGVLITS